MRRYTVTIVETQQLERTRTVEVDARTVGDAGAIAIDGAMEELRRSIMVDAIILDPGVRVTTTEASALGHDREEEWREGRVW